MEIQDCNIQSEMHFMNLSQNLLQCRGYKFPLLFPFFFNGLRIKGLSPLQLAREVLDIAAGMIKPGVTTEEIDHAVHLVRISLLCFEIFSHY